MGSSLPAKWPTTRSGRATCWGARFSSRSTGKSGLEFSELLPNIARHADDIAVVRSMFTEHRNHEQAIWMANTGLTTSGRTPTSVRGSPMDWGRRTRTCRPTWRCRNRRDCRPTARETWSSGWLPPLYQGTAIRSEGMPVCAFAAEDGSAGGSRAGGAYSCCDRSTNVIGRARPGELELEARISSFELAARMQLSATEALDITQETADTQKLYGLDQDTTRAYGKRCPDGAAAG